MSKVTDIKDREPNPDLVNMLESMLKEAKEGELRTLICLCGWNDDSWTHGWQKDNRNTFLRMLGSMQMLEYDLMTYYALNDDRFSLHKAFDDL